MIKITIEKDGDEPVVIDGLKGYFLATKEDDGFGSTCDCKADLLAIAAAQAQLEYAEASNNKEG